MSMKRTLANANIERRWTRYMSNLLVIPVKSMSYEAPYITLDENGNLVERAGRATGQVGIDPEPDLNRKTKDNRYYATYQDIYEPQWQSPLPRMQQTALDLFGNNLDPKEYYMSQEQLDWSCLLKYGYGHQGEVVDLQGEPFESYEYTKWDYYQLPPLYPETFKSDRYSDYMPTQKFGDFGRKLVHLPDTSRRFLVPKKTGMTKIYKVKFLNGIEQLIVEAPEHIKLIINAAIV